MLADFYLSIARATILVGEDADESIIIPFAP